MLLKALAEVPLLRAPKATVLLVFALPLLPTSMVSVEPAAERVMEFPCAIVPLLPVPSLRTRRVAVAPNKTGVLLDKAPFPRNSKVPALTVVGPV